MQGASHRDPLRLSLSDPFAGVGGVDLGHPAAGSSGNRMLDRPVERDVDDFVVGHVSPLFLNTPNLKPGALDGYGAKLRIVQ